jgi:hypothetical protein
VRDVDLELEHENGRLKSVGDVLGTMDPSTFLRLADQVRELEEHPGWQLLEGLTRHELERTQNEILSGRLSGIERYAHTAGIGLGLKRMLDIRDAVSKTAQQVLAAERMGDPE